MKKKVIIVKEGAWGDVGQGQYERMISLLKRRITQNKGIEIKIAPTLADAQGILRQEEVSSLVFISIGMLPDAREIKDEYPGLRVVILTGILPESGEYSFSLDGFEIVDKRKLWGGRDYREAILGV